MITFEQIRQNSDINTYIQKADESLVALGYTEHSFAHVGMVSGNVSNLPGLLKSVRFLTTAIASGMSYAAYGSLYRNALFSIGLVLFLFIMMINVLLNVFIKREKA